MKHLVFLFFILFSSLIHAGSNEFVMPKGNLLQIAPPIINKNYFLFEFGFITEKKFKPWSYGYNAYVSASLFQDEKNLNGKDKAGGLGFKGGVFLPTQPWVPLLFTLGIGYAKTALQKNPFFGRDTANVDDKDMLLFEGGALYHVNKKYFARFAYQISNVKYFKRHFFLTFGVDY